MQDAHMSTRTDLIKEIDAFLRETGMTPTRFSVLVGDRTLMVSLRGGRDPKSGTIDKIREFIAKERATRAKRGPPPRQSRAA